MDWTNTKRSIEEHEGRRSRAYKDTKGLLTAGIGRNLEQVEFSDEEIDLMFQNDLNRAILGAYTSVLGFYSHPVEAIEVLVELCFQLGVTRFRGFKKMLAAVEARDYKKAAAEILDSKLAREDAPARAAELAERMRVAGMPDPRTRA